MSRLRVLCVVGFLATCVFAQPARYDIGRDASADEVRARDVSVVMTDLVSLLDMGCHMKDDRFMRRNAQVVMATVAKVPSTIPRLSAGKAVCRAPNLC